MEEELNSFFEQEKEKGQEEKGSLTSFKNPDAQMAVADKWRMLLGERWDGIKGLREELIRKIELLKKEEQKLETLNKEIPKLTKQLEEIRMECQQKEKEISLLEGTLTAITQNMDETLKEEGDGRFRKQIADHVRRKKELERNIQTAFERQQKWVKQKEALSATVLTLEEQLTNQSGLVPEEIRERKTFLEKKEQEITLEIKQFYAIQKNNRTIYDNVKKRQKEVEEAEHRYVLMKNLADTAGGTLTGKQKVELETYIQMAFLDRILRRANVRLLTMSGGQYELKRQEEGGNKKEKAGLELDVIDHYNGTLRSVKTLSGGESFKASLSLALGLSDEIQARAGGIQLDAMFIDEGFGSLDDESLSQAMKALTSLADGNRMVGIISHVAELKEKIENKIIITKSRNVEEIGSKVSLITI